MTTAGGKGKNVAGESQDIFHWHTLYIASPRLVASDNTVTRRTLPSLRAVRLHGYPSLLQLKYILCTQLLAREQFSLRKIRECM